MPISEFMRRTPAWELRLWRRYHDLVNAERDEAAQARQAPSQKPPPRHIGAF